MALERPAERDPLGPEVRARRDAVALLRARLLVSALALPLGLLLGSEVEGDPWTILGAAAAAVVLASGVFWVMARGMQQRDPQLAAQLSWDLMLVTALAAATGGRDSQFVLFYALVVIAAGVYLRVPGGIGFATAACAAYVALPWAVAFMQGGVVEVAAGSPSPGLVVAYLGVTGGLSGVLGERAHSTREHLAHATRELDRVRVDNDAILKHLTTGVLTVDAEARVAYLNPAAEQVLGLRAAEINSRTLSEALPERLGPLRRVIEETLERRVPRARAELMLRTAAGRPLPLGISTNVLTHEERATGVVSVFQDLTEAREMERRARRNETLAEIGALSAGIAHELRNALNPISGSVECLQRELKPQGENAVLMELIVKECGRLNRFVSDLLNYSRERELVPEAVDVAAHLDEVRETVLRDPRCPCGVTVRVEGPQEPCVIEADSEMLRQVWLNLAANAIEAMGEGGVLTVRWRLDSEQCEVEFTDDGQGIAAEDLPRVAQPFFTTKKGGTGLGLAIAQRIVERHGGTLTLESEGARGTTARVGLPASVMSMKRAA